MANLIFIVIRLNERRSNQPALKFVGLAKLRGHVASACFQRRLVRLSTTHTYLSLSAGVPTYCYRTISEIQQTRSVNMATTQTSRRPASSRTTRQASTTAKPAPAKVTPKSKQPVISPDELANQVASLTIASTSTKGKQKAKTAPSSEDSRLAAMRATNSASQTLSSIVQSGWKAGSGKKPTTVTGAVNAAAKSLKELRAMGPGEIDVERAASSIIGKLLALEMVRGSYIKR